MSAWLCCGVYPDDLRPPLARRGRKSDSEACNLLCELDEKYNTLVGQESELERRYDTPRVKQVSFADEVTDVSPLKPVKRNTSILKTKSKTLSAFDFEV